LEEDLDEEGQEDYGGDSDKEGDGADLHNITLARRLTSDDDIDKSFTKLATEKIVMAHSLGMGGFCGANSEINNEIGESTSGTVKLINFDLINLIGASDGWMPPSAPLNFQFPQLQAQARRPARGQDQQSCWVEYVYLHPILSPKDQEV
jgi:hypothetical protein